MTTLSEGLMIKRASACAIIVFVIVQMTKYVPRTFCIYWKAHIEWGFNLFLLIPPLIFKPVTVFVI